MSYTLTDFGNLATGIAIGTVATWSVFRPKSTVKLSKVFVVGDTSATISVEADSAATALSMVHSAQRLLAKEAQRRSPL